MEKVTESSSKPLINSYRVIESTQLENNPPNNRTPFECRNSNEFLYWEYVKRNLDMYKQNLGTSSKFVRPDNRF